MLIKLRRPVPSFTGENAGSKTTEPLPMIDHVNDQDDEKSTRGIPMDDLEYHKFQTQKSCRRRKFRMRNNNNLSDDHNQKKASQTNINGYLKAFTLIITRSLAHSSSDPSSSGSSKSP